MRLYGLSFLLAPLLGAQGVTPPTEILHGHYEIHIDYSLTPGDPDAGWRFSTSYNLNNDFSDHSQVVRLDPSSTSFVATPPTLQSITPALGRLGPVGDPVWILPHTARVGTPYLGVRTLMTTGIFQSRSFGNYQPNVAGSISLRLVSVTGTGPDAGGWFATWYNDDFGGLVFPFDTSNGITAQDEIATISTSSHTHYSWGMTKPGTYHVTFEAVGKINPWHPDGNTLTSARQTFTFHVPFSGEVGAGHEIRISPEPLVALPAESVAYRPDRVLISAPGNADTGWQVAGTMATAPLTVANGVGVDPAAASSLAPGWSDMVLKITSVSGPGEFHWRDQDGTVFGTGAEIDLGTSGRKQLTAVMSGQGLYRVGVEVTGSFMGADGTRTAVLTYGAGLDGGFSYADWAASFEKSAGAAPGSLVDPQTDHDADGVDNGTEFMLFWQGFDPTRADARQMPRPYRTTEGYAAFEFLRDTRKDNLSGTGWRLMPEASRDLRQWKTLSPALTSYPLDLFETAAEEGNARGAIMRRNVRMMPGPEDRAFYRFRVATP